MADANEHSRTVPDSSPAEHWGLSNRDGVFYAQLQLGEGSPLVVALHGVTSESQARAAIETLGIVAPGQAGPSVRA